MRQVINITKALADENRLRILMTLTVGELCVCQITELLGLATSTVSKHLSILRQAELIDSRKEGRWIFYRLAEREACCDAASSAVGWLRHALACDKQIRADRRRIKEILDIDPEELCRRQCATK